MGWAYVNPHRLPDSGKRCTMGFFITHYLMKNVAMPGVRQSSYRPWMLPKAIVIVLLSIMGCGGGLTTYPAKGKVVFKDGRPVTSGGRVEFQSTSDHQVKASGWIDFQDGSFSLTTYKDGKQVEGAVEGSHRVVIELRNPVVVVRLPNVYTVGPQENDFTIEVPRPRR